MTNQEFKNLARNQDGDIIDLYDLFLDLTDSQINHLTGDDWQRVEEYREELMLEIENFY
jgi:hypothetical protein